MSAKAQRPSGAGSANFRGFSGFQKPGSKSWLVVARWVELLASLRGAGFSRCEDWGDWEPLSAEMSSFEAVSTSMSLGLVVTISEIDLLFNSRAIGVQAQKDIDDRETRYLKTHRDHREPTLLKAFLRASLRLFPSLDMAMVRAMISATYVEK